MIYKPTLMSGPQEEDAKSFTHVAKGTSRASPPSAASDDNRKDGMITQSTSAAHNTLLNPKIPKFVKVGFFLQSTEIR